MNPTWSPDETFVEGIVVPIDWGPEGEVLRIAILTPDEGEYEVWPERAGARLLDALRQQVEARVRIQHRPGDRDLVTVYSFAVFTNDDRLETLHASNPGEPSLSSESGG